MVEVQVSEDDPGERIEVDLVHQRHLLLEPKETDRVGALVVARGIGGRVGIRSSSQTIHGAIEI